MHSALRRYSLAIASLVVVALSPHRAVATWPHDTYAGNVPLCTAAGTQTAPSSIADGAGGAIVVWEDARNGTGNHIYAQRVSASGAVMWTSNGVAVCTASGAQATPTLAPDGAGGAIIVWTDTRNGATSDLYAQRVNAAGAVMWASNGVPMCTAANNQFAPTTLVSDGAGGAIAVWTDFRATTGDVYAQRVSSSGIMQWVTNGVALCAAANDQASPVCTSDGAGGAIAVWYDYRLGSGNVDILAQRVNAAGIVQWTVDGVGVCTAGFNQFSPAITGDGVGGAIIAWSDLRSNANYDIYAQHLSATGTPQWTVNGVAVCSAISDQSSPRLAFDGAGGAIVTWQDFRSGVADVYAQRVGTTGTGLWAADGVPVCTGGSSWFTPQITADGASGAIFLWSDYRSGSSDVYAQRVSSAGTSLWATNGVALCTAASSQTPGSLLVSDGAGGVIGAWGDSRSGSFDIYAQRVDRFGYLGAEPQIASVRDVPNDQGGVVKVSWYPSWLDTAGDPNLTTYDVYRSVPGSLAPGGGAARGARRAAAAQPPVYLPALYAWEYLGSVSAVHFLSAYGFLAPTTGDSLGGSNPRTAFLVVGRNASGSMYWMAPVDSGYSVDNLAPGAVTPFSGVYAGGVTTLNWDPSDGTDFSTFRLYRDTSAGFVPGPTNLLAQQTSTGYVDVVGSPLYYKICAVDVHGNAGPYSTVFPSGVVASGEPTAARPPATLALTTGPATRDGAVRIRWALPQAAAVRLTLHTMAGRRVCELAHGLHAAGEYVATWDGRDASGTPVAAGLYVAHLAAGGRSLSTRVLRVP